MVRKMNKKGFVLSLSKELNYSEEKCNIINDVLEDNFVLSKKSKDKIIKELIIKLKIDSDVANNIYDTAVKIINDEIKRKLKHPFKNID